MNTCASTFKSANCQL